jgi:hypothetical protein
MTTHMLGLFCFFISTLSLAWLTFGGEQAQLLTAVLAVTMVLAGHFHHQIVHRFRVDWKDHATIEQQATIELTAPAAGGVKSAGGKTGGGEAASPVSRQARRGSSGKS